MGSEHKPEPGVYALGPQCGAIRIKTFKEGLLSPLGHDLTLEASEWRATVRIDRLDPPAGAVELDVAVPGLRVVAPEDLGDKDREEILRNIRSDVLHTAKFPKVRFRSTDSEVRCTSEEGGTLHLEGELEIHGVSRKTPLQVHFQKTDKGLRVRGETALRQTEFGVKPYKAPLGVIKVRDEVRVLWDILVA